MQKGANKAVFDFFAEDHQRQHPHKVGHACHHRQLDPEIGGHAVSSFSETGFMTAPSAAAATAQMMMTKPDETDCKNGI